MDPNPIHFPDLPCLLSTLAVASLAKETKTKNKQTRIVLLHLICLSITYSFVIEALEAAVYQVVDPFAQATLLVLCNELLVWFKTSGFCYPINAGPL